MEKGIVLVFSAPASAEQEEEYNHWYEKVHIPEVLAIPGFRSARRYRLDVGQPRPPLPGTVLADQPYVAVYEVEAERFDDIPAALRAAVPKFQMSPALCLNPPPATVYYRTTEG